METDTKYPYLTAWAGSIALSSLIILGTELVLLLVADSWPPSTIAGITIQLFRLIVYLSIAFTIFQSMIKRHILPNVEHENLRKSMNSEGFSVRHPYLTAWLAFFVLNLIPAFTIRYLARLTSAFPTSLLVEFVLDSIVGFFIFRFVVQRYIVGHPIPKIAASEQK